jgi:hypothetical protein
MGIRRAIVAAAIGAVTLFIAPAGASADGSRPSVTTARAAAVAQTTARLRGSIHPHGTTVTYFFQYGTDALYSARTPETTLPKGDKRVRVVADIAGLTPATRYHFRLVARNVHGLTKGADRTLRTPRQPLGFSLTATPNPVRFNGATTISGTLTGTGADGRPVILQANPFPYSSGFVNQGNPLVTDAQGNFSFPVLSVPVNTQYRVVTTGDAPTVSTVVGVNVVIGVRTKVRVLRKATRRRGKARVRFSGRLRPARDGAEVDIQRLARGTWAYSRYRKTVRIRKGGTFRVWAAIADGSYASNAGRTIHLKLRRR